VTRMEIDYLSMRSQGIGASWLTLNLHGVRKGVRPRGTLPLPLANRWREDEEPAFVTTAACIALIVKYAESAGCAWASPQLRSIVPAPAKAWTRFKVSATDPPVALRAP
jgi:hypothetical protein